MTTHLLPQQAEVQAGEPAVRGRSPSRGMSLYLRVLIVDAAVLVAAVVALALSPLTISSPLAAWQGLMLAVGVLLIVVANAVLLRSGFRGLSELAQRMDTLDLLRPEDRLAETGSREVRALIGGFNAMLDRLEAERSESTRRTLVALESERRRIGMELHDEIGQRLTGMLLQLSRVAEEAPAPLRRRITGVQNEGRATLDEVGALAWQLRPSVLDDLGLLSALETLADSFVEHPACTVDIDLPAELPPMAHEVELAVYRVAQEAITNTVRHSRATSVRLTLAANPDTLSLDVVDNGGGVPGSVPEGPGIRGMRERALLVGGRLHLDGAVGRGVTVRLQIPRGRLRG